MGGGGQCCFDRLENRFRRYIWSAGERIGDLKSEELAIRLTNLRSIQHDHFTRSFGGVKGGHGSIKTGETLCVRRD